MQNIGELEGLDSDQTFINQASNDEPPKHSTHQVYWYQNDHLGTPRELTSNSGNIEWEAVYQAWGNTVTVEWEEVAQVQELNPIQLNGAEQSYLLQPHRFQGQIYDVETGLHYNRFRYYDPDAGRFVSHDPIGLLGGDNHFQYAPNPVEWVDPWGLSKSKPINLPSIKKIVVDMVHILDRHTSNGNTAKQRKITDLFPDEMSPKQIEKSVKEAYCTLKPTKTQGERIQGRGTSKDGTIIEMWFNKATKVIETAYPKGRV